VLDDAVGPNSDVAPERDVWTDDRVRSDLTVRADDDWRLEGRPVVDTCGVVDPDLLVAGRFDDPTPRQYLARDGQQVPRVCRVDPHAVDLDRSDPV
jgi:hypothetical protein